MSRSGFLKSSLKASLAGGVCALALVGAATAQTRNFDVPAGGLKIALDTYARQSGVQLIYRIDEVSGVQTHGVQGPLSSDEALSRLLDGTTFQVRRDPSGAVAVSKIGAADPQGAGAGGGAETNVVQELVVTAQKKSENIQVVPIAISAFTQQDLTTRQVAGGPDLMTQVPNMTFTKTNFSSYSIQIRGIGTQAVSATTDPAVAVAFNNSPFIRNRFFEQEFYDLERVEVLRGPQGTLYGRNATGGVVNIISAKPTFDYEAKASADIANYSSRRVEGMLNIPLVEDKVALRLAGAWTKRDGYDTNQLTGSQIDGRDLWSTRVSLRFAPSDKIGANLIWEHFQEGDDRLRSGKQLCKEDEVTSVGGVPTTHFQTMQEAGQEAIWSGVQATFSQGCGRESLYSPNSFQTPNGLMLPYYVPLAAIGLPIALTDPYVSRVQSHDLRTIESTVDPDYHAKSDLGELQVRFDIGHGLTLQSETAYNTDTVYSQQDFNRFNTASGAWEQPSDNVREGILQQGPDGGIFCDPQLGCSDRLVAVDVSTAKSRQFSQEFRLSSDFSGRFNFSLGANFLRYDTEDKYYVFINSLSLLAAKGNDFFELPPYVGGKTDNVDCLLSGYAQGDPNAVYAVTGCTYVDPNPLGGVNDQGHNYFLSRNPYKLISYAAFGEAYYNITDTLKLTGGLRWTVDKKDAPRIPTWIVVSNSVGYPVAEVVQQDWSEPTGRVAIDWKPVLPFTDQTLLYASYAHGYKAGGANPPGFVRIFYADSVGAQQSSDESATRPKTFDAEFVNAFELGSKNTFADGKATLNLAAFYYDYKGYQVSEIVDRSAFNRNFDATVWGVEIESDWRPLKNLRLGFKGGYEKTRIADGEQAVDLMDRTAGHTDWVVVRPFPTYASSCVLPVNVFVHDGVLANAGGVGGGNPGACEEAYLAGLDPVTNQIYEKDPQNLPYPFSNVTDYPGFDPKTAPNHGEGFFKQLGGNELPNAPHWTATITGDYTVPLAREWTATLHTDVHWQSQSWWRVFNDNAYDKLHPYFTMNLAAIFRNERAGWNIMAYVKNVTNETAITGAFLNSDDTGLTTNVFLTEPRLYGLRVTKDFTGIPLLEGFDKPRDPSRPYLFNLELGGSIDRVDAPNGHLEPSFTPAFVPPFNVIDSSQDKPLDWGDGRDVKITYRPNGGPWTASASLRYGKTNGRSAVGVQKGTDPVCAFANPDQCAYFASMPKYAFIAHVSEQNRIDATVDDHEEYRVLDFTLGRDLGIGGLDRSTVGVGVRLADFKANTDAEFKGVPDWHIFPGFFSSPDPLTHTVYKADVSARRKFEGAGPVLSWQASLPILDRGEAGHADLDWTLEGGALFGRQKAEVSGSETATYFQHTAFELLFAGQVVPPKPVSVTATAINPPLRSSTATVPTLGASLGVSYKVGGASVGAGYRWERFFNAIDGGFRQHESFDRTIDGPYVKVSLGFGG